MSDERLTPEQRRAYELLLAQAHSAYETLGVIYRQLEATAFDTIQDVDVPRQVLFGLSRVVAELGPALNQISHGFEFLDQMLGDDALPPLSKASNFRERPE